MVRPSVRPRLVEEGVPIGYSENERDEIMVIEPMSSSASTPATVTSSRISTNSQSSLLRAAGGIVRPPRRSTKIVIGGDSFSHSHQQPQPPPRWTPEPTHHAGIPDLQQYSYTVGHTAAPPRPASHYLLPPAPHRPAVAPPPMHHHPRPAASRPATATHIEIGSSSSANLPERMEGVEDHSETIPLVVLDGANVAYAYAESVVAGRKQPDMRGLYVAWRYWNASVRVSIVVPQPYLRDGADGPLWRDHPAQYFDTLRPLMVAAPSRDDDDAYALQIAKRENQRAVEKSRRLNVPLRGPAYIVSNDMFRDAQQRDASGQLGDWLNSTGPLGPGRISYTFCDLQRMNEYGEQELDFLPNSRHALVEWIEKQRVL